MSECQKSVVAPTSSSTWNGTRAALLARLSFTLAISGSSAAARDRNKGSVGSAAAKLAFITQA
jgi:hypothetical protein